MPHILTCSICNETASFDEVRNQVVFFFWPNSQAVHIPRQVHGNEAEQYENAQLICEVCHADGLEIEEED